MTAGEPTTMPDETPIPAGPRLDAVALTSVGVAAAVAVAVVTHPPLFGLSTLNADLDSVVGRLVSAAGFAVVVPWAGWLVVATLYVLRRGWPRIAVRAAGWTVLTAVAAAALDWAGSVFGRPGTAFGPGGSVGAFLRLSVTETVPAAAAWLAFLGGLILGLVLVADATVRTVGRWLWAATVAGNSLVERTAAALYRRLSAVRLPRRPEVVDLTPAPVPVPVPVFVATPEPEPEPEPVPKPEPPPPVMAPVLRIVADEEPEEDVAPTPPRAFELPPLDLLTDAEAFPVADHEAALRDRAAKLEQTFTDFGLNVKVVGIHTGPVITQYEIALETGLRLSRVTTLADDVALNLKVPAVRIVAPLPGRNTVGIEVPNDHRQTVRLKELIANTQAKAAKFKLPVFLGKDVEGRPLVYDLASMPHLLIAGRTGTGKSVCLNTIILSLLYTRQPDDCRLIMIDPKKVELSEYGKIPHLMHPVVTDDKKAEAILAWAVEKMEERYEWLRRARVRNIAAFNDLNREEIYRRIDPDSEDERQQVPTRMPYIVIIIDEVGDLIMSMKKEVESHIIRLAQKSRAAGIHIILATQKPTVDVITGLIKSNLPARICFQVASRADSMVVLDEKGADKLLGAGDMLFLQPGTSTIIRGQGAYVTDDEISKTVGHLETDEPNYESELLNLKAKDAGGGNFLEKLRERDAIYEQAIEIVVREQRGSTSLLQRALTIGYGRASRLIDFMAEDGIVGGFNGSNARDVLLTPEDWEGRKQAAG